MSIGAADRMTYRVVFPLFADRISRREDAVIYCAGFSNWAGSLALRLWDKSNDLAHIPLRTQYKVICTHWMTMITPYKMWDLCADFKALQAATK
jgi:hypothetical protein